MRGAGCFRPIREGGPCGRTIFDPDQAALLGAVVVRSDRRAVTARIFGLAVVRSSPLANLL